MRTRRDLQRLHHVLLDEQDRFPRPGEVGIDPEPGLQDRRSERASSEKDVVEDVSSFSARDINKASNASNNELSTVLADLAKGMDASTAAVPITGA
jgi:hypothetical protein